MLRLDRQQVLAYRIARHGLHREPGAAEAVLDLGVQDAGSDAALLALAARGVSDVDELAAAWSLRGAPHLHRPADLRTLPAALWPRGETDALARLSWQRARVQHAGMTALQALRDAARGMRAVITAPMSKGAASTAVTRAVPDGLSLWCRGCQATHIHEQLFRLAALPAGLLIDRDAGPLTLVPTADWPAVPEHPDPDARAKAITAYLRLHGPATAAEVAGFLGSTQSEIRAVWPDGLTEVSVEGRAAWLPDSEVETLREAEPTELVRLLPQSDPYLQARDRPMLVPDKALRKEIWRVLGNPGVLLVDDEIAGTWRPSKKAKRLELTVRPFWRLSGRVREDIQQEAQLMAQVRGVPDSRVRYA